MNKRTAFNSHVTSRLFYSKSVILEYTSKRHQLSLCIMDPCSHLTNWIIDGNLWRANEGFGEMWKKAKS